MPAQNKTEVAGAKLPDLNGDPVERRRLLNILAQRRYRRRKQARLRELEANALTSGRGVVGDVFDHGQTSSDQLVDPAMPFHITPTQDFAAIDISLQASGQLIGLNPAEPGATSLTATACGFSLPSADVFALSPIRRDALAFTPTPDSEQRTLIDEAYNITANAISVPKLNIIHAHVNIVQRLYGPNFHGDLWDPTTLSPFTLHPSTPPHDDVLLEHFRPTSLQRIVPHHPVLDVLPWSGFRERFLYVMTLPTEMRPRIARTDMASVVLELMFALGEPVGGMRIWGSNPFSLEGWEMGAAFYSKFWWAVDGEMVKQSDRMRLERGEEALRFNVVDAM